jgi:Fur family ferric uptake transcriptional regulator
MACEETFLRELRERGFRMTPQREMVLSAMHEMEGLATADDIYWRVQRVSSCVDISTIYRTLELLQALSLVASIEGGDGQRSYELSAGHGRHAHLVCRKCGGVLGAEMVPFDALAAVLRARHGFTLELDNLTFAGICAACAPAAG